MLKLPANFTPPPWIAQSRKAKIALSTMLTVIASRFLPKLGLSASDTNAVGASLVALASAWMGSIAVEDAGAKAGGNSPKPDPGVFQPGEANR
jgi:hypothetical protein